MSDQIGFHDTIRIVAHPQSTNRHHMRRFLLRWDYSRCDVYPEPERTITRLSEGTEYSDGCVHIHLPSFNFDNVEQMKNYFEMRGKCEIEWLDKSLEDL